MNRFPEHSAGFTYAQITAGQNFQQLSKTYRVWERQFNTIWSRLEGHITTPPRPVKSTGMKQLKKLLRYDTIQGMKTHWFAKPEHKRELDWRHTMLTALNFYPERAAEVLHATLEARVTPSWAVSDVFCFLVRWSSTQPDHVRREQQDALAGVLLHLLQDTPPRAFQLKSWVIEQIMSSCAADAVITIYSALRHYHHPVHFNTQLQAAGHIVRDGRSRLLALRIFEDIVAAKELDINDRRLAALATSLLALPKDWKEGRHSPTEVQAVADAFERILSLGYSPNYVTYTSMIRALCLTDQLETAWKIYEVMRDRGTTLDPHLYSILLDGARQAGSIESAIRVVDEMPLKFFEKSPFWNDVLHTIIAAAIKESRLKKIPAPRALPAFNTMLRIYLKFFKVKPLQALLPVNLHTSLAKGDPKGALDSWDWGRTAPQLIDKLPTLSHGAKRDPDPHTLVVMLKGYINSFDKLQPVRDFYFHFRTLLGASHPVAVSLVKNGTHPYDMLIQSITENHRTLEPAVGIVREMLADAAPEAPSPSPSDPTPQAAQTDPAKSNVKTTGATHQQHGTPTPRPSIFTWNNLLTAFTHHAGMGQALATIGAMRRRGIHPNRVTWNTLATGYARRQREPALARAVRSLEISGYHPDVHTVRAVSRLQFPEALLAVIERRAERREVRVQREVHEALGSWVVTGPGRRLKRAEIRARSRAMHAAAIRKALDRRVALRTRAAARALVGGRAAAGLSLEESERLVKAARARVGRPLEVAKHNMLSRKMALEALRQGIVPGTPAEWKRLNTVETVLEEEELPVRVKEVPEAVPEKVATEAEAAPTPTPDPDVDAASRVRIGKQIKTTPEVGAYMELFDELVLEQDEPVLKPTQDQTKGPKRRRREGAKQHRKE